MTSLDQLLLVSLLSVFLTLLLGSQRWAGWMNALLYLIQTGFVLNLSAQGYGSAAVPSSISLQVFGHTLGWQFDALSWFFALITVVAALLVSWYAAGEWGRRFSQRGGNLWLFQLALSLNVFSMLLLLSSADLLSLFIGWELVSWASFLLMAVAGGVAAQAALRYVTYAFAGAMALLLSAHPQATLDQLEQALRAGAEDLGADGPDNDTGHGRLDVVKAEAELAAARADLDVARLNLERTRISLPLLRYS